MTSVPSALRMASMLAIWLLETQLATLPAAGVAQSAPEGSGSRFIVEEVAAVIAALPVAVGGVTVTLCPEMLTTPVKSSIRSSWPAERFEFCRGSVKAVTTLVFPELVKFRLKFPFESVMALERLKSIPKPVFPLIACEKLITGAPALANVTVQMALAWQTGLTLVIAAPLVFTKLKTGFAKETVIVLLVPVGTPESAPRKAESDCKRIRSTTRPPFALFGVKVVLVPPEEVSCTPVTVTRKLTTEMAAGGVSATITKLTVAVPPPPPAPPPPPGNGRP